jgi:hypothetical protein
MHTGISRKLILLTLSLAALISAPAAAVTLKFSQNGFNGGGTISGTFTGADLDANGQLSSFAGEITAYSATFSGNSFVPAFTHTFADLIGLVFDLGQDALLGNGTGGDVEGVSSLNAQFQYSSGVGPTGVVGGFVENVVTGINSATSNAAFVVPEPAVIWLMTMGLFGVALTRRTSRTAR